MTRILPHQQTSDTSALSASNNAKRLRETLDSQVADIIRAAGHEGCTVDEVRQVIEERMERRYERTTIGSRITEGKNDGLFVIAPFRRESAMKQEVNVYMHRDFVNPQGKLNLGG